MKRYEALKKLHEESTVGFWRTEETVPGWNALFADQECVSVMGCDTKNAKFLVAAANEAPHLMDDVKVLSEALQGIYSAVDSCVDLTPEVMADARAALKRINREGWL